MQYIVIAHDGDDPAAQERRIAARPAHSALGDKMFAAGKMLYGAAILNEQDQMIGSVLICDFKTRQELDEWLKVEPYMTGGVWKKVEVKPCRVGPSFVKK